jgi:hypothetical protein
MGMGSERCGREKKLEQEWDSSGVTPQPAIKCAKAVQAPVALRGFISFTFFFLSFFLHLFFLFCFSEWWPLHVAWVRMLSSPDRGRRRGQRGIRIRGNSGVRRTTRCQFTPAALGQEPPRVAVATVGWVLLFPWPPGIL